jgi:hypothetical protein
LILIKVFVLIFDGEPLVGTITVPIELFNNAIRPAIGKAATGSVREVCYIALRDQLNGEEDKGGTDAIAALASTWLHLVLF